MKIVCYGIVAGDIPCFKQAEKDCNVEMILVAEPLNDDNVYLAEGCDAVSVTVSSVVPADKVEKIASYGIKLLAARSVGFNYIDLEACKKHGIRVANTLYNEHCVADFTLMMMLMAVRKAPYILAKSANYDYSVQGMRGKDMKNLTVGVIGTGRIGKAVIERIHGFGSKILAFDLYPNESLKDMVEYVSQEELLKQSDVITFHAPATKENYHLINDNTLKTMKDGVILVNTARGDLIENNALLNALDSGKVSCAALDTFEGELGIIRRNFIDDAAKHREVTMLQGHPNIIITPHVAYYTDETRNELVYKSIDNLFKMRDNLPGATEVQF